MKRSVFTLLICCLSSFLFANVKLNSVQTSYNSISKNSEGCSQQTVYSDDGMEITAYAKVIDDKIQYTVIIKDIQDANFLLEKDCLQVFSGSIDNDEWYELDYVGGTKTGKVSVDVDEDDYYYNDDTSSVSSNVDEDDFLTACVTIGTAAICTASLIDFFSSPKPVVVTSSRRAPGRVSRAPKKYSGSRYEPYRPSPRIVYHRHHLYPETALIWVIDREVRNERQTEVPVYNNQRSVVSTQSEIHGDKYIGTIISDFERGPDYRLRLTVSDEEYIDFYFTRTDKAQRRNKNKTVVPPQEKVTAVPKTIKPVAPRKQPVETRTEETVRVPEVSETYNTIAAVTVVPEFKNWGAMYIYNGTGLGCYAGFKLKFANVLDSEVLGVYDDDSFAMYDDSLPYGANSGKKYEYGFDEFSNHKTTEISMDIGLTLKLFSHTYLMGGCDITFANTYKEGIFSYREWDEVNGEWKSWHQYEQGWLKTSTTDVIFSPQIGLDFVFGNINIGTLLQFTVTDDIKNMPCCFNLMAGISF